MGFNNEGLNEELLKDVYCAALQRAYADEHWGHTFRDAVIVESSNRGIENDALIDFADALELQHDRENYSDTYKEVHGFRPRGEEFKTFSELPALRRMMELNLLQSRLVHLLNEEEG
jgi:hypothetical protein